jgi:D-alanyl-lipoteichoic acid acyltransferase DltB (MBOAT superfamily)
MGFVSLTFFVCLAVAATVFYAVPCRWRTLYLLVLCYAFYASWSLCYLLLLVLASLAVFAAGRAIAGAAEERRKKLFLACGIALLLLVVAVFKLGGEIKGLLFPLGLSYYSFKLIAYLVDVYWDETAVETDALTFCLYPAFFPQIVSGPIQRPHDFFAQWRRRALAPADFAGIEDGFRLILGGLMLKLLIADRLGAFIAVADAGPERFNWSVNAAAICCYTLQLYADFAGYTNIALGVGKLFGITGPPNFNAPFAASNIQEMWRRWHMSLTLWLTDYLFMPLQMALRGLGRAGLVLCITTNMVAIGLWHGLTLNFLCFGAFHAACLNLTAFTARPRRFLFGRYRLTRAVAYAGGAVMTFGLMTLSMLFFHTQNLSSAWLRFRLLTGITPAGALGWGDIRADIADPVFACMALAYYFSIGSPGLRPVARSGGALAPSWLQYGLALLLISAMTVESGGGFIYGQF